MSYLSTSSGDNTSPEARLFSSMRERFLDAKEQIDQRWIAFSRHRKFKPFEKGKSDALLQEEFDELHQTRQWIWTSPGYEAAEHLIQNGLVRAPGCSSFGFNHAISNYNASILHFGERYYLACEGPRSQHVSHFFRFLSDFPVTHLVRLTDSHEGGVEKCHPYWEGWLRESPEGFSYLHIPSAPPSCTIRAFDLAGWKDNQGIHPDQLLPFVLQVRQSIKDSSSLLVVHCSAGVGRTGTFFAALALLDFIDNQIAFSIEEMVYRLSLQRAHSVGKSGQYITLHRLAEKYLCFKS